MIKINNLKKCYGETIACDIPSFQVNDGDILGLVGNTGAGKTTLFRLMLDLARPDEGSISIDGINPAQSEDWKDFTGAWLDKSFLIDFLTPAEYLGFVGKLCRMSADEVEHRKKELSPLAGADLLESPKLIRELSDGNRQKTGIAAALLHSPRLLILDEPFNFLDPTGQNMLKQQLTDYHQQTGATILLSSHNLQHTIDVSTRIVVLENGRIIDDIAHPNADCEARLNAYFQPSE